MANGGGLLSRTVISTAGMAVQGLARFAYTLAIGRLAGPESLGDVSALLSVAVYASLFWPAAAGVAGSRFLPVAETRAAALRTLNRSVLLSVAVLVPATLVTAWLLGSGAADIVGAAALVLGYSGYVFVRGALLGDDRIGRATLLDTVTSVLAITALVLVLVADWHWALLLPLALGYALFAVLGMPRGSAPATPAQRAEVLRFTRDCAIALLATGGLLPATMILVRATEPALVAGLFAAGLSLATPANLVAQAVNQVLIPHFARMQHEPVAAIRASHARVFVITAVGFVVVFGVLIALAPWILTTFYGAEYAEGAFAMQLLLVGVGAMSIMSAPGAYLVATGRQGLNARIWIVAMLVGTVAMIALAPAFGQWGALAGFLLGGCGGSLAVIVSGLSLAPKPVFAGSQGDPEPRSA